MSARTPWLLLALTATACARPQPELPEGALLSGEVEAGRAFFAGLQGWEDTRLSAHAVQVLAKLKDCGDRFTLRLPEEGEPSVTCEEVANFEHFSQGHPLVFALARAPVGRLLGWIEPGQTLRIEATLADPEEVGPWGALLPSRQEPGPAVLSDEQAVLHGRVRAARLAGLTELVESGGQGDSMFGLKSELFTNSVLDGTWEFAVYLPGGEAKLPRVALAVGVRSEDLARAALDAYIAKIEKTWKVSMNRNVEGALGCFDAVNMLPDLAPCGAIERGVLLLAWNRASLEHARGPAPTAATGSFVRVNLGLFPEADKLISLNFAPTMPPPAVKYPWSAVVVHASHDDLGVHLSLEASPR